MVDLAPHPRNGGFVWEDHTGPFGTITPEQAKAFDNAGFFVLENAFTAEEIAAVRDEIDGFEEQTEAFLQSREGGRLSIAETGAITFTVHLVTRSPLLKEFSKHPVIAGICADLVGPDVNLYWDHVYKSPRRAAPLGIRPTVTLRQPLSTSVLSPPRRQPRKRLPAGRPRLHGRDDRPEYSTPLASVLRGPPSKRSPMWVPAGSSCSPRSLPHLTGPAPHGRVSRPTSPVAPAGRHHAQGRRLLPCTTRTANSAVANGRRVD